MQKWLLFVCVLLGTLSFQTPVTAQGESGELIARVNNLRASLGLPAYSVSSALTVAAQQQAQWIAETGNVSHTRPDGSGPRTRALNAGYPSTEVSENIYGGTRATVDAAWNFWINSSSHYAGLAHRRYREVGVGVAQSSWGTAYVMVFGNPGGAAPYVAPPSGGSSGGASSGAAPAPAPEPPSFIVGIDPRGNIMHEVQPGDTLGDIALIYGYTWDDLEYMMQLNGLTDVRDLEVGSIFLVPPKGGTLTPSPVVATPTPVATARPTSTPRAVALAAVTPTAEQVSRQIATAVAPPESILLADEESTVEPMAVPPSLHAPTEVAALPGTLIPQTASTGVTITRRGMSPWLVIALAVQIAILAGAAFEFFRRAHRRR